MGLPLLKPRLPHPTTDTSVKAAESIGALAGAAAGIPTIGGLAQAMVGVLKGAAKDTRRSGVLLAITVRREVLAHLAKISPEGATADEIAEALRRSILTVRPRVSELNKAGLIRDSGSRRPNASGHEAIVWLIG